MNEPRYQQLGFELLRLNPATAQAAWPRLPASTRAWFIARAASPGADPIDTIRRFREAIRGLSLDIAVAAVGHMDPADVDHVLCVAVLFRCYPPNVQVGDPAIDIARELAAAAAEPTPCQ